MISIRCQLNDPNGRMTLERCDYHTVVSYRIPKELWDGSIPVKGKSEVSTSKAISPGVKKTAKRRSSTTLFTCLSENCSRIDQTMPMA